MKEQENNSLDIADIIVLVLQGKASEQHQQKLEEWIGLNPKNRVLFKEIKDKSHSLEDIQKMQSYSLQESYQRIGQKAARHTRNNKVFWLSAASLIMVLGFSSLYFLTRRRPAVQFAIEEKQNQISPAKHRALMLLDNGKEVKLHPGMDSLIMYEGMEIQLKGDSINYLPRSIAKRQAVHQLYTPKGATYKLRLSDGTVVWMNTESWIKYPTQFGLKDRKVEVYGEVFFDVAADPVHPFIVSSFGTQIMALGTAFNVNARLMKREIQTTLISGSVLISRPGNSLILSPGEQATTLQRTGEITKSTANIAQVTGWTKERFVYKSTAVKELLEEMGRWYNVKVIYRNGFNGEDLYTGEISRTISLNQVIALLEKAGVAKFEINDNDLYVMPIQ